MDLIVKPSRLSGHIAVSGSKSHTIRGIVGALCAEGTSELRAVLDSADTRAALNAAKSFGARVEESGRNWKITGVGKKFRRPDNGRIDMANSGTGLRLLTGVAALQDFAVTFDGDASLRTRPMATLLAALRQLGAEVIGDRAPFTLRGPIRGGATKVDGASSQFLSSLLFALPLADGDSVVRLPRLLEQPYIEITLTHLRQLGVEVRKLSADYLHWEIPGNQKFRPLTRTIPADFSTAAFPLVAGVLCGKEVVIENLDFSDPQGDKQVFEFVRQMGGDVEIAPDRVICRKSQLHGVELDLNSTPDALPILAVAAAFANGRTVLGNVPQARLKETDRISVMAHELGRLGVKTEELPDGLVIYGGKVRGGKVDSHDDHRVEMAFAVAGMALENSGESVTIGNAGSAAVSYPDFVPDFRRLGADLTGQERA